MSQRFPVTGAGPLLGGVVATDRIPAGWRKTGEAVAVDDQPAGGSSSVSGQDGPDKKRDDQDRKDASPGLADSHGDSSMSAKAEK